MITSKRHIAVNTRLLLSHRLEGIGRFAFEVLSRMVQHNPDVPSGEVLLTGDRTVTSFEGELEERFGLHAQVFRRSKNLWLQTTSTDYWSLATQNQKGLHTVQAI